MYDNYSTDNSRALAISLGFEVREFGQVGQLNDQHYLDVKNNCWKECRGNGVDYVIVCDADEFVTKPIEKQVLPKVIGYNMVSESLPIKSVFELLYGEPSESYSKQAIFNPDFVEEINYAHGCHKNNVKIKEDSIPVSAGSVFLYHYRQIGGIERLIKRHEEYRSRMSKFNLRHRMGHHYLHSNEDKINEFNLLKKNSFKLW